MKLSIKNIAKVKQADIEINGITVIAGANNTGKSTIGKALFSVFNSFYQIEESVYNEQVFKITKIFNELTNKYETYGDENIDIEIALDIISEWNKSVNDAKTFANNAYNILASAVKSIEERIGKNYTKPYIEKIIEVLEIPSDLIASRILSKKIFSVFDKQVNNVNTNDCAEISLCIKDKRIDVQIYDEKKVSIQNILNLDSETIYMDDPFIIDTYALDKLKELLDNYYDDHKKHLFVNFFFVNHPNSIIDEIIQEKKLKSIYSKLDNIKVGDIISEKDMFFYKEKNSKEKLRLKNLSSGLKTFVIIKKLIQNNAIKDNGTIILDEPEIHLHPEWQLVFAELIVLLQKTFNLHILLNTHSPYFLRAIQVYSAKHEIADKCKYYLSRLEDDGAYIDDVSDDIEKIYNSLARPLQTLRNEEF